MNILINILLGIDMLIAVLMTFVILMQRPKSEGLGAAFGGGVTENIFGAQTTNVLVKFTGWLAGIFFVLTFVLSVLYAQRGSSDSALHKELMGMPTPSPTASQSPSPVASSPATMPAPTAATSPAATVSLPATAKPSEVTASIAPQPSPATSSPSAVPSASP
jgi:preprotein translocase subunit SecG